MNYSEFRKKIENLGYKTRPEEYMGKDIIGVYGVAIEPVAILTNERHQLSTNPDCLISSTLFKVLSEMASTKVEEREPESSLVLYYTNLKGEVMYIHKNVGGSFVETEESIAKEYNFNLHLTQEDLEELPENFKPKNGFTKLLESKWYL